MKRLGLIALVLMLAGGMVAFAGGAREADTAVAEDNLERSLEVDISGLRSADGQTLLPELSSKEVPSRPDNPRSLPETDPMHWYDMEYLGWGVEEKINIPDSPADGAIGKRVIAIINGDHPYLTAYSTGMQKIADAYSMDLTVLSPNWDLAEQNQMLDEAINERPDMIILVPLDARVAIQQVRRVNRAGVPIILSNMLPEEEAMQYAIAWTGPDDWGQFREMARVWADELGRSGGVAYIRHAPGGSPYFARTYGPITELAEYAPDIETLDMQAPGFEAEATMQVVSDWLTRFGDRLTGIGLADDSAQAIGTIEALRRAGREDVLVIAAGNSKVGMDMVKDGDLLAITYQSAEADGAVALKTAVDWFNGLDVDPVLYIPKQVITQENVEDFMPAQW
ncbi:MAG: sugar ABC transporter substrate-binding protein [Spirochaetaceae bacterium]|nr:MAG: sugar ABC transporter substrate-binding protein [Spirochaetaceae bacterium]